MSAAADIETITWARKEIVDLRAHVRALTVDLNLARMARRDHEKMVNKLHHALNAGDDDVAWDLFVETIENEYAAIHGPRD